MGNSRADAVEFRFRDPRPASEWVERAALYETFRKSIDGDPERNLKAIPRKQRAMVRKGMQNALVSETGHDSRRLHAIYAASVRNLGTPVFSRRYFETLVEVFRDECDIVAVLDGDTPIAAVLNFYFRDEVLPYYGSRPCRPGSGRATISCTGR